MNIIFATIYTLTFMPLFTKWRLQKTNIKRDTTLKRIYMNKKDIKIGDVVRLFLYKSKTCNELDYIIQSEDIIDNVMISTIIGCNLLYVPIKLEWKVSTNFTDDKIDTIMQYHNEEKKYIIELSLNNTISSNDDIYNQKDNIIELKTEQIPNQINIEQRINEQAIIKINLFKKPNSDLGYFGNIFVSIVLDNNYYKSYFVPQVLRKYYFVYESLYWSMRACYKITEKKCRTKYKGILVNDYLSKDDENLIPPDEIEFTYSHIFQFISTNKKSNDNIDYVGQETNDCTNWHGQCFDTIVRTFVKKGDTVRCKGIAINKTASEENKIVDEYCNYFLILEVDGINIKGELQDPYRCGSAFNGDSPLQYSVIQTTINCISEIPIWLTETDTSDEIEERRELFNKYLLNKRYLFTGYVVK